MDDGSRYVLSALLAVPAPIAGCYAFVIGLPLGPAGLFVPALVGIAAVATLTWLEGDDEPRSARRTTCTDRGAPNPTGAESCGYCEAVLGAE